MEFCTLWLSFFHSRVMYSFRSEAECSAEVGRMMDGAYMDGYTQIVHSWRPCNQNSSRLAYPPPWYIRHTWSRRAGAWVTGQRPASDTS